MDGSAVGALIACGCSTEVSQTSIDLVCNQYDGMRDMRCHIDFCFLNLRLYNAVAGSLCQNPDACKSAYMNSVHKTNHTEMILVKKL